MRKTNYFKNFNKTIKDGIIITNLLNRADLRTGLSIAQSVTYDPYIIKDGQSPERIAELYYGNVSYFWIILFANGIKNIYEEWPKSNEVFNEYIISKYGNIEYAQLMMHHYEDSDGDFITEEEWLTQGGDLSKSINIFDYEEKLNDEKRVIKLIRNEYKHQLINEFNNIFS
jgi:hypothetical protein